MRALGRAATVCRLPTRRHWIRRIPVRSGARASAVVRACETVFGPIAGMWHVSRAVKKLRDNRTDPAHVNRHRPGICGNCYEVGRRWKQSMRVRTPRRRRSIPARLAAANRAQLEAEGVTQVECHGLCTKETDYLPRTVAARRHRFAAIVALALR